MTLAEIIDSYVAHKRSLGMRFDATAKLLRSFQRATGPVEWEQINQEMVGAFLDRSHLRASWHTKYYALNGLFRFAIHRGLLDASPLPYLIPKRPAYATPYIYSSEELRRLLDATATLEVPYPKNGQRPGMQPQTLRTLILLLYGAGLRLSEALSLTTDDVDLSGPCLVVRNTKFFKTRLLPIGPKLASTLALYGENRVALARRPPTTSALFLDRWRRSTASRALSARGVPSICTGAPRSPRSPSSAPRREPCRLSTRPKWRRFWPRPTGARARAPAITRCCSFSTTPGRAAMRRRV